MNNTSLFLFISFFMNIPLELVIRGIGEQWYLISKNTNIFYSECTIDIRLVLNSKFLNSMTKYTDRFSIYRWALFSLLLWRICFSKTSKSKTFLLSFPFYIFSIRYYICCSLSFSFYYIGLYLTPPIADFNLWSK